MPDVLVVQGTDIRNISKGTEQFICLTDIANRFGSSDLINDWLKNKNTLEFLGVWEKLNNDEFDEESFSKLMAGAGVNRFRLSAKQWVSQVHGTGIFATAGRYGATYAHKDIAVEFCSWLSPEFKLYLITEIQRLKKLEDPEETFERSVRRIMTKATYKVHTDAVKEFLIPPDLSKKNAGWVYANEADLLNVALFGMTAKQWRDKNPDKKGNIRDDEDIATVYHLVVLNNLESQNALLIQQKVPKNERLRILNEQARRQMKSLLEKGSLSALSDKPLLK